MVDYKSYSNATLSTVLTYLKDNGIGKERIVNLFYDTGASKYTLIFVVNTSN